MAIAAIDQGFATTSARAEAPVDFARDIKPLLSDRCFKCHGPDSETREADLRLDLRANAVEAAIVPGDVEESELYHRITSDDPDEKMPPVDSNRTALTPDEIALVRRWILQGAKYAEHWAYVRPVMPAVPLTREPQQVANPVDAFLQARLQKEDLASAPEADRRTLIRRLSFDLLGLPPSPSEVDAFVNDTSPDAYESLVDRLLESQHYGERMAQYWLDVVRYADTAGYHSDNHREHSSYRDYVIKAFNDNVSYKQFVTEQLAGDLLPDATYVQRIASGFNRLNMTTEEGGAQAKEYAAIYAADRVRNTASIFMGVTLGCSQCHDHKFDPFTIKDFYSFAAFFADLKEDPIKRAEPVKLPAIQHDASDGELSKETNELPILISEQTEPRMMRILPRGNWLDDSGEVVQPNVPAYLGGLNIEARRPTRLDLALWLTAPENPLVSRVMVNRLWKLAFGHGLVRTMDDLGAQGRQPSHPRLLDWLAVDFVDHSWDIKRTIKLLVMSQAYRQSSRPTKIQRQRDPENDLFARQSRYRLDAEIIRDDALAISGLLVRKIGGRSVKPYQPVGYWAHLNFPVRTYEHDKDENQYRRGLYTYWCRTFPHPSMLAFDAPAREECTVERPRSNTPLAALVLLNDPTYVEAARVFAGRIIREGGDSPDQRIGFAFREALARQPNPREVDTLVKLYEKHLQQFQADQASAAATQQAGMATTPGDINPSELAAWTSVARTILNLHETITRN